MTATEKAAFATWLHGEGYRAIRDIGGGRWAAVFPFIYTTAVMVGAWGDRAEILDRWCYHDAAAAVVALATWDGEGEPTGWHRHPMSGRRVVDGEMIVRP